jgi:hypothetical protein
MLAFDVEPDGTISKRRDFARYKSVRIPGHVDPSWNEDNGADGMAVDGEGRVYAATNVGVEVFSPRGDLLGIMPVQWGAENNRIRHPQNVAFGGPDRKTLTVGAGAIQSTNAVAGPAPHPVGSRAGFRSSRLSPCRALVAGRKAALTPAPAASRSRRRRRSKWKENPRLDHTLQIWSCRRRPLALPLGSGIFNTERRTPWRVHPRSPSLPWRRHRTLA